MSIRESQGRARGSGGGGGVSSEREQRAASHGVSNFSTSSADDFISLQIAVAARNRTQMPSPVPLTHLVASLARGRAAVLLLLLLLALLLHRRRRRRRVFVH